MTVRKPTSTNLIEAANCAEVTAILIRAGYRVYRPEADVSGEDLIIRIPEGELRSVQDVYKRQHDASLRCGHRRAMLLSIGSPVAAEDVRHFQLRAIHAAA